MDDQLRQRAATVLQKTQGGEGQIEAKQALTVDQAFKELQLHQIELEMQNEELRRSQDALQAAQDRYFDFYDLAPVGYCTVDETGQILQANITTASMLGMSREALEQQDITRFIDANDQEVLYLMRQRLKESNAQQTCELRLIKIGGEPLWVQLLILRVAQPGTAPVLRIILTDITERKHYEVVFEQYRHHLEDMVEMRTTELTQAKHAAEAAKLAQSVFLGQVGQEMRTPLKAILECARRLRDDPETAEHQRPDTDQIYRNSDQLLNVINELLDMARIEAGRMETERMHFDLREMLQQLTDEMQPHAAEKGLALRLDPTSVFPPYFHCDERKLRQVLTKLIDKAIQCKVLGDINVHVSSWHDQTHQPQLTIEIRCQGAVAQLQPNPQDPGGNGLGVLVSQRLIRLMGGSISDQSASGMGSLFHVELPIEPPSKSPAFANKSENGRVLGLAPGQAENSKLLTEILDFSGLHVRVARNGEQGVTQFSEWNPHLILMSLRMPVMDGLAATQKIRSLDNGHSVKIVAVITSEDHEKHDALIASGMNSVIGKPYEFDEIYGALKAHLGIRFYYESSRIGD